MRVEVKKMYHGCVDVRDYVVEKCISEKEPLQIQHGSDIMTIAYEDLKRKVVSKSKPFASKHGSKPYCLLAYEWFPDEIEL